MDIRHYVHIKKVPGGSQKDCLLVNGTICTKNIADKKVFYNYSSVVFTFIIPFNIIPQFCVPLYLLMFLFI